ncbi:transketolase [Paraburkholderia phenoliruptrix]|uniref:transketolase n=1 Tax=Paraburkholderia phenoliruptrix TaxID=252970 RepID=UPI002869B3F3|nr:transketolase [Paraburkholderia phenoliruptrix]WMY11806.1 transketolase [Paraburkholderia phenoliruptrix]
MENPFKEADASLHRRAQEIRKKICVMNSTAKSGHTGGDMSEADILAALYFHVLDYEVQKDSTVLWHDEFILSKGHGVGGLYATFAELGWLENSELLTYLKDDSRLPGHPVRQKLPTWVTVNTGGLGHGLPIAAGLAMAKQRKGEKEKAKSGRVFVLTGDGELEEGSNWEAAMSASHFELSNLVVIVDRNRLQLADFTHNIMDLDPLDEKFRSFGFEVHDVNGNEADSVCKLIESLDYANKRPKVIIAHTIKGRGVSFMENVPAWHHKFPNDEQLVQALKELDHA